MRQRYVIVIGRTCDRGPFRARMLRVRVCVYLLVDDDLEQFIILERLGAEHQAILELGQIACGGAVVIAESDTATASPMEHVEPRWSPCRVVPCGATVDITVSIPARRAVAERATHRRPSPFTARTPCTRDSATEPRSSAPSALASRSRARETGRAPRNRATAEEREKKDGNMSIAIRMIEIYRAVAVSYAALFALDTK